MARKRKGKKSAKKGGAKKKRKQKQRRSEAKGAPPEVVSTEGDSTEPTADEAADAPAEGDAPTATDDASTATDDAPATDTAVEATDPDAAELFDLDGVEAMDEEGVDDLDALVAAVAGGTELPEESEKPEGPADDEPRHELDGDDAEEDLGDDGAPLDFESTPEHRARLLAATVAHAEMQEARYRVPTERRQASRLKGVAALMVFVLAGSLAIAPPDIVVPDAPVEPTSTEMRRGVVAALALQAQQIEAFRTREGRIPREMTELAVILPGIRYVWSSNRLYQLVAYGPDGEAVIYDSASPAEAFRSVTALWEEDLGS